MPAHLSSKCSSLMNKVHKRQDYLILYFQTPPPFTPIPVVQYIKSKAYLNLFYLHPSFHPFLNHFVTIFHSFIQTKGNDSGSCGDNSSNSSGSWGDNSFNSSGSWRENSSNSSVSWGDNSSNSFHPSSSKLCLLWSSINICNIQFAQHESCTIKAIS